MDNQERAERAKACIKHGYDDVLQSEGGDEEGLETAIQDLINDLLHLHMQNPLREINIQDLFNFAEISYNEECDEEALENLILLKSATTKNAMKKL